MTANEEIAKRYPTGSGVIYVNNVPIAVSAGSAVYVETRVVHGIDSLGEEPMGVYWLYGPKWLDKITRGLP